MGGSTYYKQRHRAILLGMIIIILRHPCPIPYVVFFATVKILSYTRDAPQAPNFIWYITGISVPYHGDITDISLIIDHISDVRTHVRTLDISVIYPWYIRYSSDPFGESRVYDTILTTVDNMSYPNGNDNHYQIKQFTIAQCPPSWMFNYLTHPLLIRAAPNMCESTFCCGL